MPDILSLTSIQLVRRLFQVEDAIVAAAVEEGLVTPHTSAVGVLLQVRCCRVCVWWWCGRAVACLRAPKPHLPPPPLPPVQKACPHLPTQLAHVPNLPAPCAVLTQADPLDPEGRAAVKRVEVPLQLPAGRQMWAPPQQSQPPPQLYGGAPTCSAMMMCAPGGGGPFVAKKMVKHVVQSGGRIKQSARPPFSSARMMPAPAPCMPASPADSSAAASNSPTGAPPPPPPPELASCTFGAPPPARGIRGMFSKVFSGGGGSSSRGAAAGVTASPRDGGSTKHDEACDEMEACAVQEEEAAVVPAAAAAAAALPGLLDAQCGSADLTAAASSQPSAKRHQQQQHQHKVLAADEVLSLLNMRRTAAGSIPASQEVMEALAGRAWQQQQQQPGTGTGMGAETGAPAEGGAAACAIGLSLQEQAEALLLSPSARPPVLTGLDDVWVTLLALAFLRKHLGAERHVWGGLEAKALEWLAAVWPEGVGRSVGSLVLAAMKLV